MKMKAIAPTICFFSLLALVSCAPQDRIDLARGWRMKVHDADQYKNPGFDDTSWETVDLPKILTKERKRQVIWLRKTFIVPKEFQGRDLAVEIGKIWEVDRTYLNGMTIGAAGEEPPRYLSLWNYDRYYAIPEKCLLSGEKNVIAIRMFTNGVSIFEGRPFIAGLRPVRTYNFFQRLVAEYICIALSFLSFFLGIISLIQFLAYRKNRLPLYYSLCSLLLGISVIQYYAPDVAFISSTTKDNIFYTLMPIIVGFFYFLFENLLNTRHRVLRIVMLIVLVIIVLLALTSTTDDPIQGRRFDLYGALAFVGYLLWGALLYKTWVKIKTKELYILSAGYVLYMSFTIHDMLMMMGVVTPKVLFAPFAFSFMHICIGVVLTLRSSVIMKTDALKKYLPPQLVDSIIKGKQHVAYENDRRKLTVFFSDIKGFTETTDNMEAEELAALLNEYMSEMTAIADRFGGTIDKFVGDAIMIFFGAPESGGERDDAHRCVSMAMEMQRRMRVLQKAWYERGVENPLQIRVGINTGVATVGNFGAEDRLSYTAIGGQVNLAARLESACDPGGILISHTTWALVKEAIPCARRKGKLTVKGIHRDLTVYDVMLS